MIATFTLLACLACTLFMTGVIVFVRVVHYPLFALVGEDGFRRYHAEHVRRTTSVVVVPMVAELALSLLLVFLVDTGLDRLLAWAGFSAAALTWIVTGLASVPAHNRLATGFDPGALRSLLRADLLRGGAWLAHSATLLVLAGLASS